MSSKSAAQQGAQQAGLNANTYGANATNASAQLNPFYNREMKAEHEFDPTQINEMLTAAEAGTGGATGALQGDAKLEAARLRNPSGFAKSLDEVARDKDKAIAGSSEGIAAEDVLGAQKLRQEGAQGEAGLFGEDVNAQLGSMGIQSKDIAQEDQGFLADLEKGLNTATQAAGTAMTGYKMANA